jgi:NAD(P)-dependent dehydrogenase (short-subunit alcohol dehydrogenase family)
MEGKVIAITGGASGMGLALATLLATKGAKISICDVVQSNLDKASQDIPTKDLLASKVDVRDIAQVESWISETIKKFGRLDGAANLAGIIGRKPGSNFIPEHDEDDWDRIIGINLTGVMHSLKAELKVMLSQSPVMLIFLAHTHTYVRMGQF